MGGAAFFVVWAHVEGSAGVRITIITNHNYHNSQLSEIAIISDHSCQRS